MRKPALALTAAAVMVLGPVGAATAAPPPTGPATLAQGLIGPLHLSVGPGKAVTEVTPAGDFWEAEPEHQDYLQNYPTGYTCHFVRPDWKLPRRATAG